MSAEKSLFESTHKQVLALRATRLASVRGHIVLIPAGEPTWIPKALYLEAAKNGCVDYNPEMIAAFQAAIDKVKEGELGEDMVDVDKIAKDAVRHVMLASATNPGIVTTTGVPRVAAVRIAFEELCADQGVKSDVKITTELVTDYYLQVQEEDDLTKAAVTEEARYPEGVAGGDLEGEEVGGDIDAVLETVAPVEE